MTTIRKTENQLALGRKEGLIGGPIHLGVGQEAIAVGVSVSEILVDIFPSKTLIIKGVKNEIEPKNLVLILPNFCSYLRNNFLRMLKLMTTIRKTENQLALGRKEGLIGGPIHLGVGQDFSGHFPIKNFNH
jgi:TPP-dependent pyruvate/acetoin dehydrogenase alpha subunit